MDKTEIFSRVCDILVSDFEFGRDQLKLESRFYEDLDLDSIDAVDMIVRLQQQTDLKVKAEDFKQIRTLGDLVDVLDRLFREQGK